MDLEPWSNISQSIKTNKEKMTTRSGARIGGWVTPGSETDEESIFGSEDADEKKKKKYLGGKADQKLMIGGQVLSF